MRILAYIIIVFSLLSSSMIFAQISSVELRIIRDSIELEINDTLKSKWVNDDLMKIKKSLDNPDSLFPYSDFDSVYYFRYGTNKRFEPTEWNEIYENYIIDKRRLAINEIDTILFVVNNPLLFIWGECGTPFIEGSIIFYVSGKEVASINCACSGGQLFFEPDNTLARWGVLNETGYKMFYKGLKEKHLLINAIWH